jgi:DNA-binding transcriptional regulator YiaG
MMSHDVQKLHDAVLLLGDAALEIATALSAFTKKDELVTGDFRRPGDPKPTWDPKDCRTPKEAEASVPEAPSSMNITSGAPLTAERFNKLMSTSSIELWVLACCDQSVAVYHDAHMRKAMPRAAELYASFDGWCRATDDNRRRTQKTFSRAFNKSGFRDRVTVHGRGPGHPVGEKSYVTGKVLSSSSTERRRAARKNAKRRGFDLEHWSKMVRTVRMEKLKIGRPELARMLQVSTDSVNQWEGGICFATSDHRQVLEVIANSMCGVEARAWRKPQCD